ncbi:hypothetical protein GCM10025865_25250 [Paraoerskovia sediminicola]|uniref:Membrane protein DedA, SNARE-associated domain n=1 Tax=Paraoerskovia sediminicola TaxID=1138587 RepID=A0ABM8G556_9CELL|nr:hypothetical protein [Paraoerskovia sediminicola]BDZ43226.1 hypothetical protein GCM10025865_25250 [Paraoerskovia sediminicola]
MPAWLDDASFWPLFAFFFAIVFFRTQATYWIARLVTAWTLDRSRPTRPWVARTHAWLTRDTGSRGFRAIERWGLLAIPASFLMTGTKTVVNGAAGVLRMPFGRYLAAMTLGSAVHATIYATVGWAAWTAAVAAAAGSPWGAAALAVIVALVALVIVLGVRRRRARVATVPDPG